MLVTPALLNIPFHPPTDFGSNYEIILRWIHFAAAITWIGLLYFFNLVNMPLQKQMDAPTKAKVNPTLLSLALWWFRWGAVVTVLAGIVFWSRITVLDARNHGYSAGSVFGSFFLVWTLAFVIEQGVLMAGKGALNQWSGADGHLCRDPFWRRRDLPRMEFAGGEQPRARDRRGRRAGMVHDAERVGHRVAGQQAPHRLDPGDLRCRSHARQTGPHDAPVLHRFARQLLRFFPMLFFMGAASHYPLFGR